MSAGVKDKKEEINSSKVVDNKSKTRNDKVFNEDICIYSTIQTTMKDNKMEAKEKILKINEFPLINTGGINELKDNKTPKENEPETAKPQDIKDKKDKDKIQSQRTYMPKITVSSLDNKSKKRNSCITCRIPNKKRVKFNKKVTVVKIESYKKYNRFLTYPDGFISS